MGTVDVYVGIISIAISSFVLLLCWLYNRNSILPNWPVVGMIPNLLYNISHIHDFATDVLEQSKGTFFFKGPWFCGMDFFITSDPMNAHYTFSKNFSNYPKGSELYDTFGYLGESIFNTDFDAWRAQRKIYHSFFKDKRFEFSLHTFLHHKFSNGLFSVLDHACKHGKEVDLQDMFQRFTFDNTCFLVFGLDPNTLSIDSGILPFEKAFDDISEVFLYRHIVPGFVWKFQKWLQIGEEKKMAKACQTFDQFVEDCIKRREEQLQKQRNNNEFNLQMYFREVEENEQTAKVSNKFLKDAAVFFLFAGRDTTSAALAWTFWVIGTNPSLQKKILEEMEHHFGHDNDDKWKFFDFEKLRRLVYLHATICEVLRLYPSVPFEHRVSIKSDVLPSGHRISKNTKILYSFYSMGRSKEIWGEDCLEFKPERWIYETGGVKSYPSYKFVAFNVGSRSCLGKDLALMQIKAVVCAILWNYSVELIENQDVKPSSSIILRQKNGLKVMVSTRKS